MTLWQKIVKYFTIPRKTTKLYIAKEFCRFPDFRGKGAHDGAAFRPLLTERFHLARQRGEPLEVIMDGVHCMMGSFFIDSFAALAKELKEKENFIITKKHLIIHGDLPHYPIYIHLTWKWMHEAMAEVDGGEAQ